MKKRLKTGIFLVVLIGIMFLSLNLVSADSYAINNPAISPTSTATTGLFSSLIFPTQNQCKSTQDFVLQIAPMGCENTPVRSDLLADQNVPVFCPVIATQINPLIDVNAIKTIDFSGNMPQGVEGMTFVPYRAALAQYGNQITNPVADTVGYVVIVLNRQPNESALPNCQGGGLNVDNGIKIGGFGTCWINGSVIADIKYDIQNAFGVGQANYYLPETSDQQWEQDYNQYSFWNGRGYLRAESVTSDSATVDVYSGTNQYGTSGNQKIKVATVNLQQGKESQPIPITGFSYCFGTMNLELNGLVSPNTLAKLNVNGNIIEVQEGQTFADGKCSISSPKTQGVAKTVGLKCDTDSGTKTATLSIDPQINMSVNGQPARAYSSGEALMQTSDNKKTIYLGYIGRDKDGNLFAVLAESTAESSTAFKNTQLYKTIIPGLMSYSSWNIGGGFLTNLFKNTFGAIFGGIVTNIDWGTTGGAPLGVVTQKADGTSSFTSFKTNIAGIGTAISDGWKSFVGNPDTYGNKVKINGLAGAQNSVLTAKEKEYYDDAINDYQSVLNSYAQSTYPNTTKTTLGEQAIYNETMLSYKMGQKADAAGYCQTFVSDYPDSVHIPDFCSNIDSLSSTSQSEQDVNIGGKTYAISLEGVTEPGLNDYSVNITVSGKGMAATPYQLGKDQKIYLSGSDYIVLKNLDTGSATFDVSGIAGTANIAQKIGYNPSSLAINLNQYQIVGSNSYQITVTGITLHKLAEVSVIPHINQLDTNATFPFNISIEKRAIQLTPEKTRELMNATAKEIATLNSWSASLGKVVNALDDVCKATTAIMLAKSFIERFTGTGIARAKVMNGPDGWTQRCAAAVNDKVDPVTGAASNYANVDACLLNHSKEIDNAVSVYTAAMNKQDSYYKNLEKQSGVTSTSNALGESVVNDQNLLKLAIPDKIDTIKSELEGKFTNGQIKVGNQNVDVSSIIDKINSNNIDVTTWRDIQLNAGLLNSSDSSVSATARAALQSDLGTFYTNTNAADQASAAAQAAGVSSAQVNLLLGKTTKTESYLGLKYSDIQNKVTLSGVDSNTPVAVVQLTGGAYYLVLSQLGNKYTISKVYDQTGNEVSQKTWNALGLNVVFETNPYQNRYINPEASYYNTGSYAGLPAVLPIDTDNGWYVYIQPILPTGSTTVQYTKAGRVSTFYICNVGPDGLEQGPSVDDCQQVNPATGQTYVPFGGLGTDGTKKLVNCAENAIQQASNTNNYKPGAKYISITSCEGQALKLKVGTPSTGTPSIQCEDFMSPTDCNIIFNVCDPVICPSSRCNLGGAYPVSNVVQSGIVGSIVLCLPNWPQDKIPVCLTGVKAGLDAYNSMLGSFESCLNQSLQTGQTVGICDQISAIYTCNIVWKDILPLGEHLTESLLSAHSGENTQGGGEYLDVKDAFSSMKSEAQYFTQSYGTESYKAFQARSTSSLQTNVCGVYASLVVPDVGNVMNSLTTQQSPPQYFGYFSSIPYTTATNPPTSHYKVYYHIYAGLDYPVSYTVYMKGTGGSYYQDTSPTYAIPGATGYLAAGQSADATPDFTAPTGYDQLCISVNGQEDCNFKAVSTDFLANYIQQAYTAHLASNTGITTSSGCTSQDGIVRICATESPGTSTDVNYANNTLARWKDVGYCDTPNIKCWLDSDSISSVITDKNLLSSTVESTSQNLQTYLAANYIQDFPSFVTQILSITNATKRINAITNNLSKVYLPNQKGFMTLLRGDAYSVLAILTKPATQTQTQLCVNVTYSNGTIANIPIPAGIAQKDYCTSSGSKYTNCVPALSCPGTYTIPGTNLNIQATVTGILPANIQSAIASSDHAQLPYPVLTWNGISYIFYNEQWFWSPDKLRWPNVQLSQAQTASAAQSNPLFAQQDATSLTNMISLFNQQSSSNQAIIKRLVGVSYESGLNILMDQEKLNGGAVFLGFGKKTLETDNVKMDSNEVFTVSNGIIETYISGSAYYYFQYDTTSNKWQWEPVGGSWTNVPDLNGQSPPQKFQDIIKSLDGKSLAQGAQILFGLDSAGGSTSSGTSTGTSGTSCTTQTECQKILGNQIISIAQNIATQNGISDSQIQTDTKANSFVCLALLVSHLESGIQQCGTSIGNGYEQNGNPLYCDGNANEVLGGDTGQSMGAMQVNKGAQGGAYSDANPNNAYNFAYNVNYGLNLLVSNYNKYKSGVTFTPTGTSYTGWQAALRVYNGMGTGGNNYYVEQVLGEQPLPDGGYNNKEVAALFPQCA